MLLFIPHSQDNGSSVTWFQYIPCYCLSLNVPPHHLPSILFQYIPCYCLSAITAPARIAHMNFNTSHVTVYQNWMNWSSSIKQNFNTSHVTVYLSLLSSKWWLASKFQYIPCYCLSLYLERVESFKTWFQYIPCYCLSEYRRFCRQNGNISIHPMLLFIVDCLV